MRSMSSSGLMCRTSNVSLLSTVAAILVLVLCVTRASGSPFYDDDDLERIRGFRVHKRQYGDFQVGEQQATIGLALLIPRRCKEYGCGLVNPLASGKRSLTLYDRLRRDEEDSDWNTI